jgi:hypothetical protein
MADPIEVLQKRLLEIADSCEIDKTTLVIDACLQACRDTLANEDPDSKIQVFATLDKIVNLVKSLFVDMNQRKELFKGGMFS